MHRITTFLLLTALAAAGAMAGGPLEPQTPLPDNWGDSIDINMATLPTDDHWWDGFDDPVLDTLISRAEEANFDLIIAAKRMDAARRQIDIARAGYYPQIDINASYERCRAQGASSNLYSLGASVSWEIDIFGKITARARQAGATYRASRAEWVGAMVSLCSQVASTYIELRVAQAELAVAHEHILRQDTIAGITRARYESGLVAKIDLDQSLSVLYSTRAAVPSLRTTITSHINALALLLGVYPAEIAPMLENAAPLPEYRRLVSTGMPAELLRRRPDIVAAENTLAASAAAVGIARKDYLPTLSLTGNVGVSAPRPADMFTDQGFSYSIAPTLSWTLFDGFERRAAVGAARDQMEADMASYNYTVMTAYNEVAGAIDAYTNAVKQIALYEQCVEVSGEFLDKSLDLYTQGLTQYTNVATAQIDLLNYTNDLLVARGTALSSLITLYKALGGGFESAY